LHFELSSHYTHLDEKVRPFFVKEYDHAGCYRPFQDSQRQLRGHKSDHDFPEERQKRRVAPYARGKLRVDEDAKRKDIWHVSLASQLEVVKDLSAVANAGMERNSDKTSNTHPAFVLGGFIYSLNESVDIDAGVKAGLNRAEADYTLLAGLTYRY